MKILFERGSVEEGTPTSKRVISSDGELWRREGLDWEIELPVGTGGVPPLGGEEGLWELGSAEGPVGKRIRMGRALWHGHTRGVTGPREIAVRGARTRGPFSPPPPPEAARLTRFLPAQW